MKKKYIIVLSILFLIIFSALSAYSDNFSEAEKLLRKSKIASSSDEAYEYLYKARLLYEEEYNENPINIKALLGLSKVNQLTKNRTDAKLYILKAYNLNPAAPEIQKEMGDFFYNFQEYSTAIEYYKLALASGLLRDYETNIQSAKCYEKLGDKENAELYYKISMSLNSKSREALNKLNEYDSEKHEDNSEELENAKYKYLFKDKKKSQTEQINEDAEDIIENINSFY